MGCFWRYKNASHGPMRPNRVLFVSIFLLALQACQFGNCERGKGEAVEQELQVPHFHGIVVEGVVNVTLSRGDVQLVVAEGQPNLIALFTSDVEHGIWHIATSGCYTSDRPLAIHITTPGIDLVVVEGSGTVKSHDSFDLDRFTTTVKGSGTVDIGVEADVVEAKVQGSGDIRLKGRCNEIHAHVQGSGDMDSGALQAVIGNAVVAGSGDIVVNTSEELSATVQGSGNVKYKGHPPRVKKIIQGSGDVVPSP